MGNRGAMGKNSTPYVVTNDLEIVFSQWANAKFTIPEPALIAEASKRIILSLEKNFAQLHCLQSGIRGGHADRCRSSAALPR